MSVTKIPDPDSDKLVLCEVPGLVSLHSEVDSTSHGSISLLSEPQMYWAESAPLALELRQSEPARLQIQPWEDRAYVFRDRP